MVPKRTPKPPRNPENTGRPTAPSTKYRAMAMVLGLLLCYAAGTGWFLLVYLQKTGPISLGVVLAKCVVPFLLPDAVKLTLAWLLSHRLARHVP